MDDSTTPTRDARPEPPTDRHGSQPTTDDGRWWRPQTGSSRGQSELLGGILLFGLLIALLVLIQVAAVPGWNQQLEFQHSQRVQEDVQQLGSAFSEAAADGRDRTVTVETGVRYPPRPFLFNPPPPTGTLRTTDPATASVKNGQIDGVPATIWGTNEQFDTRTLRYDIPYNEYRNNPTTNYEYGFQYNTFPNGAVRPETNPNLVNGTNVNLVFVDGEYSESTTGPSSVDVHPSSAPGESVSIESTSTSNPLTIRLPTYAGLSTWQTVLGDEVDPGGDSAPRKHIQSLSVESLPAQPYDMLVIVLEPGATGDRQYDLRMAEVGVGSNYSPGEKHYIRAEDDGSVVVFQGASVDLTAQVNDRFNNPVSGVDVEFAVTGSTTKGSLTKSADVTDRAGEATATFKSTATGSTLVEARADINGDGDFDEPGERTTFNVAVTDGSGGGGPGGSGVDDPVSNINPGPDVDGVRFISAVKDGKFTRVTFDNDASTTMKIERMRVSYYFDGQGGTNQPEDIRFQDSSGGNTATGDIPGSWVTFNGPTLPADDGVSGSADDNNSTDQRNIRVAFKEAAEGDDKYTSMDSADFMIVSVEFETGSGATKIYSYFIAPTG